MMAGGEEEKDWCEDVKTYMRGEKEPGCDRYQMSGWKTNFST